VHPFIKHRWGYAPDDASDSGRQMGPADWHLYLTHPFSVIGAASRGGDAVVTRLRGVLQCRPMCAYRPGRPGVV